MTLQTLASYPQCYVCHQSDLDQLVMVCHHCGRTICQVDRAVPVPLEQIGGKAFWPNREFYGLDLVGIEKNIPVHCQRCVAEQHRWLSVPGLRWLRRTPPPPVPMLPVVSSVVIEEKLAGSITLHPDGTYVLDPDGDKKKPDQVQPTGKIEFTLQWVERDRKRLLTYAQRYGKDVAKAAIPIHAGFALLPNPTNVQFIEPQPQTHLQYGTTLALQSTSDQHDFLKNSAQKIANTWKAAFAYNVIRPNGAKFPLPIQLIPTLLADNLPNALEVVVQLRPDLKSVGDFEDATLDKLTLRLPKAQVQRVIQKEPNTYEQTVNQADSEWLELTWEGLDLDFADTRRRSFALRFAQPIAQTLELTGELAVTLKGTFSGLKGVKLFYPWGPQLEKQPTVRRNTKLTATFHLQLGNAQAPQVLVKPQRIQYAGLKLHDGLVAKLAQKLQDSGLYVKKVGQQQAALSVGGEEGEVSRRRTTAGTRQQRQIIGRSYVGVYPLDFELLLLHDEWMGRQRVENHLRVDIAVRGSITSADMAPQIDDLLYHLTALVQEVFGSVTPQEAVLPTEPLVPAGEPKE